jgi:hypothetical protein
MTDRELAPHLDAIFWLTTHPDSLIRALLESPEEGGELLHAVVRLAQVVAPIIRAWTETELPPGFQSGTIVLEPNRAN